MKPSGLYISLFKVAMAVMLLLPYSFSFAGTPVRFAYDVDFDFNFDNREFYKSGFSSSMTIFGARLTPSIGIEVGNTHKLMLGIDVMKDFGASQVSPEIAGDGSAETGAAQHNADLLREIILYYRLDRQLGKTDMTLYAGIFPRRMSEGRYSQAFFSDSLRFYDNNLEGLLLKFRRPKAYFEVGCDWMGQYGQARRERFMIYSSGEGSLTKFLSLGYAGYMYHFANSAEVKGLVDNILINPYARFDFGHMTGMQALSVRVGWLQALQNDRDHVGHYVFPGGGELDLEVRNWNFGIRNSLYYGTDIMPYYNNADVGGHKYGHRLYLGDPFYRIHDDGAAGIGTYDRLELFWAPRYDFLTVKVGALFHFNDFRYSGCQQVVQLFFDLEALMQKRNK
ncbi:MAG: hypothetical protein E7124_04505 [Bacteroidales bacterium]|nr:hypothetical protein [Bacteroidales bacterium]